MRNILKWLIFTIYKPVFKRSGESDSIYITFDDGPHPENTPLIINILEKYQTKVTFFMTGIEMEKYPHIVDEVIKSGHQIGYHSYNHSSLKKLTLKSLACDLKKGKAIAARHGFLMSLYRPPFGDLTILSFFYLITSGWKIIMWSKDSRDSYDSPELIKHTVSARTIKGGEILLFHDDYKKTVNILNDILLGYQQENIKCSLFVDQKLFLLQ